MDDTTLLVSYFSGFLGASGALVFIISYALFNDLRTTSRRLLLYLSFVDLGQAIRFLTVKMDAWNSYTCTFQSVFGIWVSATSLPIWLLGKLTTIALMLHSIVSPSYSYHPPYLYITSGCNYQFFLDGMHLGVRVHGSEES